MKLDKRTVNRLLTLSDDQLEGMILGIARDAGIDPGQLGLDTANMQGIRQALGSATQEDLDQLVQVYEAYRQSNS